MTTRTETSTRADPTIRIRLRMMPEENQRAFEDLYLALRENLQSILERFATWQDPLSRNLRTWADRALTVVLPETHEDEDRFHMQAQEVTALANSYLVDSFRNAPLEEPMLDELFLVWENSLLEAFRSSPILGRALRIQAIPHDFANEILSLLKTTQEAPSLEDLTLTPSSKNERFKALLPLLMKCAQIRSEARTAWDERTLTKIKDLEEENADLQEENAELLEQSQRDFDASASAFREQVARLGETYRAAQEQQRAERLAAEAQLRARMSGAERAHDEQQEIFESQKRTLLADCNHQVQTSEEAQTQLERDLAKAKQKLSSAINKTQRLERKTKEQQRAIANMSGSCVIS